MNTRLRDSLEVFDLYEWLLDYVQIVEAGGDEVRIQTCPVCLESKWKVYVNVEKRLWHCKHCDWGRGLNDIVQFMSRVSDRPKSDIRIEILKHVAPTSFSDLRQKLEDAFYKKQHDIEEAVVPAVLPGHALSVPDRGFIGQEVYNYAKRRGITDDQIRDYKLQYSQSLWVVKKTGNTKKIKGPFLIFPVFYKNTPVSFQGRKTKTKDDRFKYIGVASLKKYLWPLDKNLFKHYDGDKPLLLVEGVFDVFGANALGFPALCTFGKTISDAQIQLIKDLRPKEVVLAWDNDAVQEIINTVDRLKPWFPKLSIIQFIDKTDLGDVIQNVSARTVIEAAIHKRVDIRSTKYVQWALYNASQRLQTPRS